MALLNSSRRTCRQTIFADLNLAAAILSPQMRWTLWAPLNSSRRMCDAHVHSPVLGCCNPDPRSTDAMDTGGPSQQQQEDVWAGQLLVLVRNKASSDQALDWLNETVMAVEGEGEAEQATQRRLKVRTRARAGSGGVGR